MSTLFGYWMYVVLNKDLEVLYIGYTGNKYDAEKRIHRLAAWSDEIHEIDFTSGFKTESEAKAAARKTRKISKPKYDRFNPIVITWS